MSLCFYLKIKDDDFFLETEKIVIFAYLALAVAA
jgi:hypothetical protein